MMDVIDRVDLHYEERAVGQIALLTSGRIEFGYDAAWLEFEGNFPLSLTMPLGTAVHGAEVILPWLANLLPEAEQLTALARILGLSASDALAILRRIGGDTAGAISVGDPSRRSEWSYELLSNRHAAESDEVALAAHFRDIGRKPFLAGEDGVRLSLAGGQSKTVLAVIDAEGRSRIGLPRSSDRLAVPKSGAPSTLIVKPGNPYLPGIVENEAYCLALADLVGLPVVESAIVRAGHQTALAVVRYDREGCSDGSVRRLHQEDFAQANGILPGQKYEQGRPPGLDMTELLVTGRHLPPGEALKLLDQLIFNLLVANTDAHAKNYSVILSGNPRMAPLYDVSTVLLWDHVNQYHAQRIAGRKRKPVNIAPRHWRRIAEDAGLSGRGLLRRVRQLVDAMVAARVKATEKVAVQAGSGAGIVEHVAEIVEANALRIDGRLNVAGSDLIRNV